MLTSCLASPVILSAAHKDLCCSICIDLFADPVLLPCGHCFCKQCACKCLDRLPRCPLCKRSASVRSVVGVPVLTQLVDVCRQLATSCGVADLALESQWSQQPLPIMATTETPLATEAVVRPSDNFDDDVFASYGEKESPRSASAMEDEADGVDSSIRYELTTQTVVTCGGDAGATPDRVESQQKGKRRRQCVARSEWLFSSDKMESGTSTSQLGGGGGSCTQIITDCGMQPPALSQSSSRGPISSELSSLSSIDTMIEPLKSSCSLCHLSIYDRQSVRGFLRMILNHDAEASQGSLQSVTEATLFELLGSLTGPFRPYPRKKKKPRFEEDEGDRGESQIGSGEILAREETDQFAHRQCLLWSPEVYETHADSTDNTSTVVVQSGLANAEKAIRRGRTLSCALCCEKGATLGCAVPSCRKSFHIPCAKLSSDGVCILDEHSYRLLCGAHASLSSKYFK